jgi:hypothetical protein
MARNERQARDVVVAAADERRWPADRGLAAGDSNLGNFG